MLCLSANRLAPRRCRRCRGWGRCVCACQPMLWVVGN